MNITADIKYIGVDDRQIDLFEGQYNVPNGMCYNSYVITDDKIAVMDTVDSRFSHEWLDNLDRALGGRKPDYLIIQHMEPDHSANIAVFAKMYPEATIVANAKAFAMMDAFFGNIENKKLIKHGTLDTHQQVQHQGTARRPAAVRERQHQRHVPCDLPEYLHRDAGHPASREPQGLPCPRGDHVQYARDHQALP